MKYDLEQRTFSFALKTRTLLKTIPKSYINIPDINQLLRSSASVGANYLEANDALGSKDFIMRIRISLKETRESIYWLKLIGYNLSDKAQIERLIKEAEELKNIFGSILKKYNSSKFYK